MNEKTNKEAGKIYSKFLTLVSKVRQSSPLLSNLGIGLSVQSKFVSLQIMQKYTIEKATTLFATSREERKHSIALTETTSSLYECIAFFEAYLNSFYSFMQMIAKVTPYFYDIKMMMKKIPERYFREQMEHFINNPTIDAEYSEYLKKNMKWYTELERNRHAISHNVSAFLGFGKEEVEFIQMQKKRIDFFESGKPCKKMEEYVQANWNSLLDFLEFYVNCFSDRKIFVDNVKELEEVRKRLK